MVADEVSDGGVGLDVDSGDLVRGASVAGGRLCLFLIRDGRGGGGIAAAAAAAAAAASAAVATDEVVLDSSSLPLIDSGSVFGSDANRAVGRGPEEEGPRDFFRMG